MAATYTLDMSDADGNLLTETDSRLAGVNVNYQYTPEGQTSAETLTNAGTPLSSPIWQKKMAAKLGLTSCFRDPGRPGKAQGGKA